MNKGKLTTNSNRLLQTSTITVRQPRLGFAEARLEYIFYIWELSAFLEVFVFGNLLERRTLGRRSLSVEDVHVKDNILAKFYPTKVTRDWRICD